MKQSPVCVASDGPAAQPEAMKQADLRLNLTTKRTRKRALLGEMERVLPWRIAAPSSAKSATGKRDPEMKQSQTGQQWPLGMKAHIGMDAAPGLGHTVQGTTGSVNDVVEPKAKAPLHGKETKAWGDAGHRCPGRADRHRLSKAGVADSAAAAVAV